MCTTHNDASLKFSSINTKITHSEHVVAFLINFVLFSRDIKFSKEIKGDDCINIYHDSQQHNSQNLKYRNIL